MAWLRRVVWWGVGLALALLVTSLFTLQRWYQADAPGLARQTLLVPAGESYRSLVAQWERAELIGSPLLWRLVGRLTGAQKRIQAGEYQMPEQVTPKEVLQRLTRGEGLVHYKVAIIEGWTVRQMRSAIESAPQLKQTLHSVPDAELLVAIGATPGPAEGWFFPDTYAYNRGASDREVLKRAYKRMQEVLASAWQERAADLPLASPYEALTLASIVEKETGRSSDRTTISQVFNLRLTKGMKLQTDPTVIYGVGPEFAGDITYAHLRTDTPYNTYTRLGLTPTPIALPGRESIHAALHPANSAYLYFVARGDGTSQFSATLAEHNAAVRRYQLR